MSKLKKIFTSLKLTIIALFSTGFSKAHDAKTGFSPETFYGVTINEQQPSIEKSSPLFTILAGFILFIIGLFVILNKKIPKRNKILIISILIGLAIIGILLQLILS